MSNSVLVLGESGTGKTTSIKSLPPKETFIISCTGKPLPFKGWKKDYSTFSKENLKGNYLSTDKSGIIVKTLMYINESREDIKYVIVDDFIYSMSNEFIRRGHEKGYDKYNDIGINAGQILDFIANQMRDDINIALFNHSEEYMDATGLRKQKFKSLGKLVEDKINPEGLFTTVLYTNVEKGEKGMEYGFLTQNTGYNTGKSPHEMFAEDKIPNDLKFVFEMMDKYNLG